MSQPKIDVQLYWATLSLERREENTVSMSLVHDLAAGGSCDTILFQRTIDELIAALQAARAWLVNGGSDADA